MDKTQKKESLYYRVNFRPGKLEVNPGKAFDSSLDLALAYSPDEAEPCRKIADDIKARLAILAGLGAKNLRTLMWLVLAVFFGHGDFFALDKLDQARIRLEEGMTLARTGFIFHEDIQI